ncbi:MAG: S8 family serine peptidase [Gemmatimonadota bacterium]|nr:MAG: S8 family serine peptidase [Gemmatimonadota bacterium]
MPPRIALLAGLLPLSSMGVDTFRLNHPELDGRGVVVGILDSGIDAGLPGFERTTTGADKILDLRDFSREGRIELGPVTRLGRDTVVIGNVQLSGFGRVARLATPPYYGGMLRELPLGTAPAADLNGNGTATDEFPVLVAKASSGWFVVSDTDGDLALDDETPVRDYLAAHQTFSYRAGPETNGPGLTTIAVNLSESHGMPTLDFFFDNSSHGTHVAGIAAGHRMFDVQGFDGVAPGAQLLGLKIANNARGGISVTGSILRAMRYAADFAQQRNLPLVLNLSYGIGNELEGTAAIDSIIDEFALRHPEVLFVVSAGNDGPGISTAEFPGSAQYALAVCAMFPGVFSQPPRPGTAPPDDFVAWWSARGGELAKPDLCAPGIAFSNVPLWHSGQEVQPGTSIAAPYVAGAAAILQSATLERGWRARAVDLTRALANTAEIPEGATRLDVGSGVPNIGAAYRWLLASHQAGVYSVRALPDGGNTSHGTAAYRRSGLAPDDTLQRFEVTSVAGQPAAQLVLRSDVDWITAPALVEPLGRPAIVPLRYDGSRLVEPGVYVGTVSAVPASDTMAGPSFNLVNTVVVPQGLRDRFNSRGRLQAGGQRRYFFEIPPEAGGLEVRLAVTDGSDDATLHLFEPDGRPQRRRGSVPGIVGTWARINVAGGEIVPGVYEAVVVAPPGSEVAYEIEAALPHVSLSAITDGPTVTARNAGTERVTATLSASVTGAVLEMQVRSAGTAPFAVRVPQLEWADTVAIEVALPPGYWQTVTDFGVTVFDTTGAKLFDSPLNYAFARQKVSRDSLEYGGDLLIEFLPGYAHLDPLPEWSGEVRVEFLLSQPIQLDTLAPDGVEISLGPREERVVSFQGVPADFLLPQGFHPLVEVTARTITGPSTVRRGRVAALQPS